MIPKTYEPDYPVKQRQCWTCRSGILKPCVADSGVIIRCRCSVYDQYVDLSGHCIDHARLVAGTRKSYLNKEEKT